MSEMKILLISTSALRILVVSKSYSKVYKWYSSGNAWITHSIRYYWAIVSLHITTIFKISGNTVVLYTSKVTPDKLLKRIMFSPTVTLSSFLSTSLYSLSLLLLRCCRRTHKRFISDMFCKIKLIASLQSPPSPSYSEPWSGKISFIIFNK